MQSAVQNEKHVTIVGAGMAGCLMAIYLAKEGFIVTLYEARSDQSALLSNRSVNQSLSARGIAALEKIGLWQRIKALSVPQKGRMLHQISGKLFYQPYGHKKELIEWTINRNRLNTFLLNELKTYNAITVCFNEKLVNIDVEQKKLYLENIITGKKSVHTAQMIIGADGIHSVVRQVLERENKTQTTLDKRTWGYKNIYIPETENKGVAFDKHAFHLWSRKNTGIWGMVNEGFFTCTLVLPLTGSHSFESLSSEQAVLTFFKKTFPDLYPSMTKYANELIHKQPTTFTTLYTSRWYYKNNLVLIGDAAHAMTIFLGQGINAAFEDCRLLTECIRHHPASYEAAFADFQKRRKQDTDTIANICIMRFIELKDKYASNYFLAKTQIEGKLEVLFPNLWKSLYTLVVHTTIPYTKAQMQYNKQLRLARFLGIDILIGTLWFILECKTYSKRFTKIFFLKQKESKRYLFQKEVISATYE